MKTFFIIFGIILSFTISYWIYFRINEATPEGNILGIMAGSIVFLLLMVLIIVTANTKGGCSNCGDALEHKNQNGVCPHCQDAY